MVIVVIGWLRNRAFSGLQKPVNTYLCGKMVGGCIGSDSGCTFVHFVAMRPEEVAKHDDNLSLMHTHVQTKGQTVTQQLNHHLNQQAALRRDGEVRRLASERGATDEQAGELVARARCVFIADGGHVRPVKADGTLWRRPDGWPITLEDWVAAALPKETPKPRGVRPAINPFARDTWNLTEQMRLLKHDPGLAAELRQACAGG
jgi:hypothetical protein